LAIPALLIKLIRLIALAFTTAQVAAMDDVVLNTNVYITADPNGTIVTTQGVYRLTVVYAQKV